MLHGDDRTAHLSLNQRIGLQHFDDCVVDDNVRPRLGSDDSEELMYVLNGVAVALGSRPLESPGSLYITTRRVIWLSDADRGKGYAVDFLSLSLHAVSRDREACPFPCIYTQIETGDEDDEEESEDSYSEINGDLVLSKITEMRLVPSDAGKCILAVMHALYCFHWLQHFYVSRTERQYCEFQMITNHNSFQGI
ncbi:chloride conductance regulatory protein ICln-like [Zingiber officinale]|uniref:chloride conductance regulatory protein ICln-like n=1 Tax=Zingiber officinale TaxID=94328 RepID=UPI001C4CC110|nr:chloride conductance regulatory protein ICln-like [Zingiber officinale]